MFTNIKATYKVLMAVIITAVAVTGLSCNEQIQEDFKQNPARKNIVQNSPMNLSTINNGERIFTDEQIEQIGQIHNEIIIDMFNNWNYTNDDLINELINQTSVLISKDFYDVFEVVESSTPNNDYYLNLIQSFLSVEVYNFIKTASEYTITFDKLKDAEAYLQTCKSQAKNYFTGVELDAALVALTVFQNSAKLWFDETKEGIDLGNNFIVHYAPSASTSLRQKIECALMADGLSAAGALIVGAFVVGATAAGGPIGAAAATAFLVEVGLESAISSVLAVIVAVRTGQLVPANVDKYIRVELKSRFK